MVVNLEPETLAELAGIPNVRAVKQATTDLTRRSGSCRDGLVLYAGNDDLCSRSSSGGGTGGVFVYTHLVGRR